MPGQMMVFSPELFAELLKAAESLGILTEEKSMFGHRALFLNGHMFAGASSEGIWLRVGKDLVPPALESDIGLAPFEPRKGMVMKDYVVVKSKPGRRNPDLKKWLRTAADAVQKLPAKRASGKSRAGRRP